ncbi:hypothetical protein POM88_045945 [Heracleum sosnowskyi]|uniref:F-box domain-containing protein n=1 Tax=Heracleum sosnowskyi TaxID=360622 RepID=A0AAD8M5G8_9APIA|nr:hypothetical protein POM88_045945 [Heracleum sosnowskyi]
MEDQRMKKVRTEDKDRISKLPDDLIHRVMSLLDTRLAVQTSVLSKRWKYLWTTLPFLSFNGYNEHYKEELRKFIYSKFISHVFSNRNHNSRILNLELCPSNGLNLRFVKNLLNLETLCLESCTFPQNVWLLSALLTLELTVVVFPRNMTDYFLALASLRNLAIVLGRKYIEYCVISGPQLVNMKIRDPFDCFKEYKTKIKENVVDMMVPKVHMLELYEVDACKVRQIEAPVTRAINDQASPSGNQSKMSLMH